MPVGGLWSLYRPTRGSEFERYAGNAVNFTELARAIIYDSESNFDKMTMQWLNNDPSVLHKTFLYGHGSHE